MTISSTVSEISYDGDDVSVSFTIPFVFDTSADLKVIQTDADGNPVVLSSGFSVTGGSGSTGTLTLVTALPSDESLTILDDPERSQSIDYIANDSFPAESAESGFDRGVRISKRMYQLVLKSLRVADGDPAAGSGMELGSVDNRKGKYLFFNAVTGAIEYAVALATETLSQSIIAQFLNPQTSAESSAGVTIVNYWYLPGNVLRYGTNTTPGTTDMATAFQSAFNSNTYVEVPPDTYAIAGQVTFPSTGLRLFAVGATIARAASYTTVEPMFYGAALTGKLSIHGGAWTGLDAVASEIINVTSTDVVMIEAGDYSLSGDFLIDIGGASYVGINANVFHDATYGVDLSNCDVSYTDVNLFGTFVLFAFEHQATSGNTVESVTFVNNRVVDTGDSAVVFRAFANSTLRNVLAANNHIINAGKGGMRASIPAGNDSALIDKVTFTGNIISGFGMDTAAFGLGCFRDSSDTLSVVRGVTITGNVVDGLTPDGTASLLTSGLWGIRASLIVDLNISGNVVKNTNSAGYYLSGCENVHASGVAKDCSLLATTSEAGVYISTLIGGVVDFTVDGSVNGPGLYLERVRDSKINGAYHNNEDYGIQEAAGGDGTTRCHFNTFNFSAMGNGTSPIIYQTLSYSVEVNSMDDSGTRHHGDETRRDVIGVEFGATSNLGYRFFNTDTGGYEAWRGTYWASNPTARTSTTAALADVTDAINTSAEKVAGWPVFNINTAKPVYAVGAADASVWVDATGATAHSPV